MSMAMEKIVKFAHNFLTINKKTIATAESCTGGILSSILTMSPGSSRYFLLGVTAYSNKSKQKLLNINSSTISRYGAVSEKVASVMAKNVRKIAGSDFGIGITGIAGPTGSAPGKPVGRVFIAAAKMNRIVCKKFTFSGSRSSIRKQSAIEALKLLKEIL